MTEEEENPIDDFLHLSISSSSNKKGKQPSVPPQPEPERRKVVMSKPLDIFSVRSLSPSPPLLCLELMRGRRENSVVAFWIV